MLKFSQNDVLMTTSFCQNFSLLPLLGKKLKISTLDGAKSTQNYFTLNHRVYEQNGRFLNFNSINQYPKNPSLYENNILLTKIEKKISPYVVRNLKKVCGGYSNSF